jgi:hypothetical protein
MSSVDLDSHASIFQQEKRQNVGYNTAEKGWKCEVFNPMSKCWYPQTQSETTSNGSKY